jgi:MFS family permease
VPVRQIWPLSALLLGTAFLLFAGGINGLILPVRGSAEGFSAISLGLLGTGWAIGYVSGCVLTPRLVGRVGHIRSFGVMAAFASVAVLASLLLLTPWAWIPLRAISGFCFAGGAMIVESWISERSDAASRGRVFGLYTMVNLAATTAGQMTLTFGGTGGHVFFVLAAMFYCLALVPTAISASTGPRPLVSVRLDLPALWRNSPLALVAVFLVGVSNSAFGTLAAVYADRVGLTLTAIALFNSLPILAGAAAQIPVGYVSDRTDRRQVLLVTVIVAIAADLGFVLLSPQGQVSNLCLAALFGAGVFSMYPIIIAHANDHAPPGNYIQVSGGLLLVLGIGSIIGPLIAGFGIAGLGPSGLFLTALAAHLAMLGYVIRRITMRGPVEPEARTPFVGSPPTRTSTPETMALGATAEEAMVLEVE